MAVLEQDGAGTLRPVGTVPEWFARFRPGAVSAPETLGKALGSPFLENFLIDAESFWNYRGPGRLRSGLWTEAGAAGRRTSTSRPRRSASAARRILLIENQTLGYEEKQAVLQRARSQQSAEARAQADGEIGSAVKRRRAAATGGDFQNERRAGA